MKTIKHILLIIATAILFSCYQLILEPTESNISIADFEAAWKTVNSVYPYFEIKQIDWDSIYTVYRPRAERANGNEILTILTDLLKELKDQHVLLKTEGGKCLRPYWSPRFIQGRYTFNPRVVKKYFNKKLRKAGKGKIKYEILNGNIGYIYFSTFKSTNLLNDFSSVMEFIKNTQGLIIDVRNNSGGSCSNVYKIVSRFINSSLELPDCYLRGELQDTLSIFPTGSFRYLNPVVVLINGACYSGGEFFAEMMKQIPTVTAVGDTTGGGSAGGRAKYLLPSGKLIHINIYDHRRYDGLPWEGIGIAPDIRVPQTKTDIKNRRDKQLEYAIELLSDKR